MAIGITSKYIDTLCSITTKTNLPTLADSKLGNTCIKTVSKKVQKGPKTKSRFSPDTELPNTLGTIIAKTNLPTIQDIKYKNCGEKVHDKLSYHKRSDVHSQVADRILTAETRRRTTLLSCLTEVPNIPKDDLIYLFKK